MKYLTLLLIFTLFSCSNADTYTSPSISKNVGGWHGTMIKNGESIIYATIYMKIDNSDKIESGNYKINESMSFPIVGEILNNNFKAVPDPNISNGGSGTGYSADFVGKLVGKTITGTWEDLSRNLKGTFIIERY
jgi:hypothetical protein